MTKRTSKIVAEICLYGGTYAAGWLARLSDGRMLGDGEPCDSRCLTTAVFQACDAIRDAGFPTGTVQVYEPKGQLVAETRVDRPGYYGDLKWAPARQYVLSVEDVLKAAE